MRIALTGDVALELMAPYFREAGHEVYVPAGFGTWRQELLDPSSGLNRFAPESVCDVTAFDGVLSGEVPNFHDERMRTLASMPYSLDGIRAIVEEVDWMLAAAGGRVAKILAVDADNTLWDGILSEDGRDALVMRKVFQEGLRRLSEEGVLLVLLSKNDPGSLDFVDLPFVARKVTWGPKAGSLLEACRELNLGVDSVVFVDDNPHERAQMTAHLPEVTVAPWNGWPKDAGETAERQLLRRLRTYFFSGAGTTEEDRLRTANYRAAAASSVSGFASVGDYLDSLGLHVAPSPAVPADVPRLAQMAGKTNQFNATTIRRTAEEFAAMLADPSRRVFVFRAGDRFGEMGIVCYVVVDQTSRRITDFVMSCRAMGRTLEHFAYAHVVRELGYEPGVDFVPTAKNGPFKAFLEAGLQGRTYYSTVDP